jgi:16S rRNA (uracil1498-N3)-methyltransferase
VRRRFFVERFDDDSATLRGAAAEHLGRVLRAEPGQLYELSDGQRVWLGRIEHVAVSKRGEPRIEFALLEPIPAREPSPDIQLLISLIKFDRFEWCLEKATELGVREIFPLAAARTDKPLVAAAGKRRARWEKILLEAAQQSRRLRPPTIQNVLRPAEAFRQSQAAVKILFSERGEAGPLRRALPETPVSAAALAIGPEGGWTEEEIFAACGAGFLEASLGANILRTETAVLASLAIVRFALAAD